MKLNFGHRRNDIWTALRQKSNVMKAVILRDMRTRFFNHGLGFLLVSLWPLAHMLILLLLYQISGRAAPFGDDLRVFFATGLIPTLTFMYVSRFMAYSVILNRPMLNFPAVTIVDILFGRAILEFLAAFLTVLLFFLILWISGDDPMPHDATDALFAYLAVILLSIGVGTLIGIIVALFHLFATVYALFMVLVYFGSGLLFVASSLPDRFSYLLSWNPVLQCVEWMRVAYYPTYSDRLLDRTYVVAYGLTALCSGLILERIFRGKILEG